MMDRKDKQKLILNIFDEFDGVLEVLRETDIKAIEDKHKALAKDD